MSLTKVSYSMITGSVVNVLDYGADPTGTNDSTAAIQAALYAGEGKTVYFPTGLYRTTSTLYFWGKTAIIGEVTGIGIVDDRGVTIYADTSVTGFILENAAINSSPSESDILHSFRLENITIRGNSSGTRISSGINLGGLGDCSILQGIKVMNLDIGIKLGKTSAGTDGEQLIANLDRVSVYACNTGVLFEECRYSAKMTVFNGDNCGKWLHMKKCTENFHLAIDTFHAEQPDTTATELIHVENCNGSLLNIENIDLDIPDGDTSAGSAFIFVKVSRATASVKAKVRIANVQIGVGTFYVLNDTDLGVTWKIADMGNSNYPILLHNINTVLSSGQGYPIFGNGYADASWSGSLQVADAATGGNTGTCTIVGAKAQRMGGMAFVRLNITSIVTTGMTAGNSFYIRGLPFAPDTTLSRQVGSCHTSGIANANGTCTVSSGSVLRLGKTTGGDILVSDITSGSGYVYLNIAYAAS